MILPVSCPTPPQKLTGVDEYSTSPEAAPWTMALAVIIILTGGRGQVDVGGEVSLHSPTYSNS